MIDERPFWTEILGQWVWIMTGSVPAAVLAVLGLFGVQFAMWGALLVFVFGIVVAVYGAGREAHKKRLELERQLKPVLEIVGAGPDSSAIRRIVVRNIGGRNVRCRARLESITPDFNWPYPLPAPLRATNLPEGETPTVPAGGIQMFDVFTDGGPGYPINFRLMGQPPEERAFDRRTRIEFVVCVHPVDGDSAVPVYRRFYVVPQPDDEIIFTDGGQVSATHW